jgi:hypothetical protein
MSSVAVIRSGAMSPLSGVGNVSVMTVGGVVSIHFLVGHFDCGIVALNYEPKRD